MAIVTTAELADLVGVTVVTVRNWIKDGLPTYERGARGGNRGHKFDSTIAIRWLIDREIAERVGETEDGEVFDPMIEQARLNHYKANVEQLKEKQLRAELLSAAEVVEICSAHVAAARAQVLGIHSKVRARHPKLDHSIIEEIEHFAHQALNELGRNGVPDQLRKRLGSHIQHVDAAAEADAEPVGGRTRKGDRSKRRTRKVADKGVPASDS